MKCFTMAIIFVAAIFCTIIALGLIPGNGAGIIMLPNYEHASVVCGEMEGEPNWKKTVKDLWGKPVAHIEVFSGHLLIVNPGHQADPEVRTIKIRALTECAKETNR